MFAKCWGRLYGHDFTVAKNLHIPYYDTFKAAARAAEPGQQGVTCMYVDTTLVQQPLLILSFTDSKGK